MAGRKQHFIPQMVLRGFGTSTKKSVQVKVHRIDREPFLTSVEGVGAEREFYSPLSEDGDQETLDDRITAYENEASEQLRYLVGLDDGAVADSRIAAEFVVHLVTRNDHFRRSTTVAAENLFGTFAAKLGDEESARRLLGVSRRRPGKQFRESLQKAIDERPELLSLTGMSRSDLENWLTNYAVENFSKLHSNMVGPTTAAFESIKAELSKIGADAQRRALERELVPKLRVDRLAGHTWSVADTNSGLILPDCVGISSARGGMKVPLMFAEDGQTETVFVPLTKRRLMIASRSEKRVKVDPKYLNRHFARCAWDFFVSDVDADVSASLRGQIRKNTMELLENLVSSTFAEIET